MVVTAIAIFVVQLEELMGRRLFLGFLLGRYKDPKAEERVMLAIDLVGTFTTADIVARSYAAGALAIGWRLVSEGGDVVLNPSADQRITLSADDEIVVVG